MRVERSVKILMSFKDKFYRFMAGRYGTDDLSKFILGSAVALMVLNLLVRVPLLNTLVVVLLILVYVRMFSTNIQKRYAENMKYLEIKNRLLGKLKKTESQAQDLKTHHIYRCPGCGQKIRVPRGKGMIMITCPKCKKEFRKKS